MSAEKSTKKARVTVAMRSKNSDWVIGQALAALFSQDFKDFELLVIDSGSTDKTLELLSHYPHRLIEIEPESYFPGPVLNRAMQECESEIVVFQNSDGVPLAPKTLGKLVAAFDDAEVSAALARQLPRPEADSWVRRDYANSFPDAVQTPPWITLSMPLAAIRRSAWEQHPFYEDAWGSEDTEWGKWAKSNDLQIKYVPDAILMHSHNYTLSQLYGRRFIEGEADAFIYQDAENMPKMIARTAISTLKDWATCLKARDFADITRVPARRAVYHWAYLKGHRHGSARKKSGNKDWRLGQKTVLSSHESNR